MGEEVMDSKHRHLSELRATLSGKHAGKELMSILVEVGMEVFHDVITTSEEWGKMDKEVFLQLMQAGFLNKTKLEMPAAMLTQAADWHSAMRVDMGLPPDEFDPMNVLNEALGKGSSGGVKGGGSSGAGPSKLSPKVTFDAKREEAATQLNDEEFPRAG